jgi:hypothetical protein
VAIEAKQRPGPESEVLAVAKERQTGHTTAATTFEMWY